MFFKDKSKKLLWKTHFCFVRMLPATKRKSLCCSLPPCSALLPLQPQHGPALHLVEIAAFTRTPSLVFLGQEGQREIFGAHFAVTTASRSTTKQNYLFVNLLQNHWLLCHHKYDPCRWRAVNSTFYSEKCNYVNKSTRQTQLSVSNDNRFTGSLMRNRNKHQYLDKISRWAQESCAWVPALGDHSPANGPCPQNRFERKVINTAHWLLTDKSVHVCQPLLPRKSCFLRNNVYFMVLNNHLTELHKNQDHFYTKR